jgi:hypothetical protein
MTSSLAELLTHCVAGYDRRGGPGGNARRPMGREDDWDRGSDRDRYNSSRPTYSRGNSGERDDHRYGGERNEAPRSGYRPAAHVPREDTVDGTRGEEEAPATKQGTCRVVFFLSFSRASD